MRAVKAKLSFGGDPSKDYEFDVVSWNVERKATGLSMMSVYGNPVRSRSEFEDLIEQFLFLQDVTLTPAELDAVRLSRALTTSV